MNDSTFSRDKLVEVKRWFIIILSLMFTCWLLVLIVGKGMFGFQSEETEAEFLRRMVLYALAAGSASGLFWGGTDLRKIKIVMIPAGVFLGLVLISTPFMLYETISNPPTEGITHGLIGTIAILGMLFCMMIFPMLGPFISHAIWNQHSWPELREEIGKLWKESTNSIQNSSDRTGSPKGFLSIPWIDQLPHTVRALIAFILLGLIFSLFGF